VALCLFAPGLSRDNNVLRVRPVLLFFLSIIFSCTRIQAQLPATKESKPLSKEAVPSQADAASELAPDLQKFVSVFSLVQAEAAAPEAADKLIYGGAIPSMLRELDPHTQFFDPGQFEQLRQMESSEQKGFGSIVSVLPGQVIFLQTLPGTPSNKAGIQAGDELVAINNIGIRSLEPEQIIQLLTEARQQKITALIRRQGNARLLTFSLTPELVDAPSVDRAFMLEPGYGYIRVTSWDLQTAKQLQEAVHKLGGASLQGLVLDLRDNPGGVVRAALDAAAMFLQPGQRILTAKGRATEREISDVPKNANPYHFKLAVVINGKTASASEILSGALQDHDRAAIVGEPSYGKGLVQSVIALSDGAGLAITTAFYYTPSGRSIQRPLKNSALSETFSDSSGAPRPAYKTDDGRIVLGGGGIQPDLIVYPNSLNRLESVLEGSGALTSYATQYIANHPNIPDHFAITPEILDDLKVYLSSRRIQPTIAEWAQERTWVSNRLQQAIVTQARGVAAGDEIEARTDAQVQAGLKAARDNSLLLAQR
jgi:carboxyl-terminal processing protease